jgi:hypothetical protein
VISQLARHHVNAQRIARGRAQLSGRRGRTVGGRSRRKSEGSPRAARARHVVGALVRARLRAPVRREVRGADVVASFAEASADAASAFVAAPLVPFSRTWGTVEAGVAGEAQELAPTIRISTLWATVRIAPGYRRRVRRASGESRFSDEMDAAPRTLGRT